MLGLEQEMKEVENYINSMIENVDNENFSAELGTKIKKKDAKKYGINNEIILMTMTKDNKAIVRGFGAEGGTKTITLELDAFTFKERQTWNKQLDEKGKMIQDEIKNERSEHFKNSLKKELSHLNTMIYINNMNYHGKYEW